MAEILYSLFQNLWSPEKELQKWEKGVIIKTPKWGISQVVLYLTWYYSVFYPKQHFNEIILNRIKDTLETILKSQDGFRV